MKHCNKYFLIAAFIFFVIQGGFAQEAVLKDLIGTVEIQRPGSTAWEKAEPGIRIAEETVISTGFKSSAAVIIGNSQINVRPLTRLSFREIRASAGTETINVGLQAGRIKVDVNASPGTRLAARVQTPVATASVRGTVFEIGSFELWVIKGSVEYAGTKGAETIVDSGGYSHVNEKTGQPAFPRDTMIASLDPDQPIGFDTFLSFSGAPSQKNREIVVDGELEFD